MTQSWLRDKLQRDTAPVSATNFVTGDKFAVPIKLVPRHSYTPGNLYQDAKNRAMSSLRRDSILAKEQPYCPVLSSANTNALYCRAVMANWLTYGEGFQ